VCERKRRVGAVGCCRDLNIENPDALFVAKTTGDGSDAVAGLDGSALYYGGPAVEGLGDEVGRFRMWCVGSWDRPP